MRLPRLASLTLSFGLLALGLAGAGCGSGSSSSSLLTITSRGTIDGAVAADGSSNSIGIFPQAGSSQLGSGPTTFARGIYVFDLPAALVGKTIDSATLQVDQFQAQANAYTAHGNVVADHINLQGQTALSGAAFAGFSLLNSFGTVSTNATLGVKTLDVTVRLQADMTAGRTTSSFRLHFVTETGVVGFGMALFSDGEGTSATAQLPQLVINYH